MLASEVFFKLTQRAYLYNIQAIENIPSILQHGILCHNDARRYHHISIALEDVQKRRDKVGVPNGMMLHQYANLYFDYFNPMLSRVRDQNHEICILAIDSRILDVTGCVLTDRNAARDIVRFLDPVSEMDQIDFDKVYAKNWNHMDVYEKDNHKAIKCAEALIPRKIPCEYITAALVADENARQRLIQLGFTKKIHVDANRFF